LSEIAVGEHAAVICLNVIEKRPGESPLTG
jgi:hypothetical protein